MKILSLLRAGAAVALLLPGCATLAPEAPDLILFNARVHTVDDARPEAQAVAIRGDRIVAVGTDAQVRALAGAGTRALDLEGGMVLPGFNDAHTHFGNAVEWYFQALLMHVEDEAGMVSELRKATARVPKGFWITGGDWGAVAAGRAARQGKADYVAFTPSLEAIDAVSPDHPVLFRRHDHSYFINSAGMRTLRFDPAAADPPTGRYGRDPATRRFNGMLYGSVGELIDKQLPPPSHAQGLVGARGVQRELNRVGITSIHDIARIDEISRGQVYLSNVERSHTDVKLFEDLRDQGELSVRVYAMLPIRTLEPVVARGIRPGSGDAWVRFGALKEFADNGYMLEPYADRPGYTGGWTFRMIDEAFMASQIRAADAAGFDVAMHVLGDRALRSTLDWYEAAAAANGPRDRRMRLIHVWYAQPEELARAGRMHAAVDVTPFQLLEHWGAVERAIGPERARTAYAWRTMIERGARVNLVSDLPGTVNRLSIAPYAPLENIYMAITRQDLAGEPAGGWHPEQRLTIDEAIRACTINPAWSSHEENVKGSITVGKLADMVVLSRDIRAIAPREILDTRVRYTIVGGRIVHAAK